jgi:hypothetical protein
MECFTQIVAKDASPDAALSARIPCIIHVTDDNDFLLNRSLSFIVSDPAVKVMSRKDQLEKSLSQITGGQVTIYDIHDAHKAKLGSVIHAWISSPSKATIDLRNLQSVVSDIVGERNIRDNLSDIGSGTRKPKKQNLSNFDDNPSPGNSGHNNQNSHVDNHHESIHTASVIRNEYQTLLWVLAFFVLLTIVFLVILICIWWCCCCRQSSQQIKQWMEQGGPSTNPIMPSQYLQAPPPHSVSNLTQTKSAPGSATERKHFIDKNEKNKLPKGYQGSSFESDEIYFRPRSFEERYGLENPSYKGRHTGTKFAGQQGTRVKKITRPKNPRGRIHPTMTGTSGTTMDTEDMVYLLGGGERGIRVLRSDGDAEEDSRAYALRINKSLASSLDDYDGHQRRDSRREKKTEIMYIRSPPEQLRDDDLPVHEDYRSASEALQINDPDSGLGDYFGERRRSSVKQVSFQMQPISRGSESLDSVEQKEDERARKMRRSPSEHTIFSQDKVFGCEDSASHRLPVNDDEEEEGRKTRLMNGQRPSSRESASGGSSSSTVKHITTVTLPGTVERPYENETRIAHPSPTRQILDVERISSDSDSGIGSRLQKAELNLKNKNLMEKKSIFTLAYDGVKTERIRTAGSGHDSY